MFEARARNLAAPPVVAGGFGDQHTHNVYTNCTRDVHGAVDNDGRRPPRTTSIHFGSYRVLTLDRFTNGQTFDTS